MSEIEYEIVKVLPGLDYSRDENERVIPAVTRPLTVSCRMLADLHTRFDIKRRDGRIVGCVFIDPGHPEGVRVQVVKVKDDTDGSGWVLYERVFKEHYGPVEPDPNWPETREALVTQANEILTVVDRR